jgi:hypothetical protein
MVPARVRRDLDPLPPGVESSLRDRLGEWATAVVGTLREFKPRVPELPEDIPLPADIPRTWWPLIVIADMAGVLLGHWTRDDALDLGIGGRPGW